MYCMYLCNVCMSTTIPVYLPAMIKYTTTMDEVDMATTRPNPNPTMQYNSSTVGSSPNNLNFSKKKKVVCM